jgi:hypothetical protein
MTRPDCQSFACRRIRSAQTWLSVTIPGTARYSDSDDARIKLSRAATLGLCGAPRSLAVLPHLRLFAEVVER